ncbi:hypothetical protein PHLGIDRAFT_117402 [Phlebiopsis gigantea 11061_1 CR5-6]|uniref:Uncharacterized protein n=1 Tax=Phlebiopsis gigantea (strain 11061_1 CR5-6) TaxID=745531 RepID=A0A0C3NSW3_PHLG1|nr:hypothetical protein PHLGIDRAFT_117402 [Phlebiopsis gigantea 11061_1 CR5-6]
MPWNGPDWEDPALWAFPAPRNETYDEFIASIGDGTHNTSTVDQTNAEPMAQHTLAHTHGPGGPFTTVPVAQAPAVDTVAFAAPPAMNYVAFANQPAMNTVASADPSAMNPLSLANRPAMNPSPFTGPAAMNPSPFTGPAAMNPSPFTGPAAMNSLPFAGPPAMNHSTRFSDSLAMMSSTQISDHFAMNGSSSAFPRPGRDLDTMHNSQQVYYGEPYRRRPSMNVSRPAMLPPVQQHHSHGMYSSLQPPMPGLVPRQQQYPAINSAYGPMRNTTAPGPVFNSGTTLVPLFSSRESAPNPINGQSSSRNGMSHASTLYPAVTVAQPTQTLNSTVTAGRPHESDLRAQRSAIPANVRPSPYNLRPRTASQKRARNSTPGDKDEDEDQTGPSTVDGSLKRRPNPVTFSDTRKIFDRPNGMDLFCVMIVKYLAGSNFFGLNPTMAKEITLRLWCRLPGEKRREWQGASLSIRMAMREGIQRGSELLNEWKKRTAPSPPPAAGEFTSRLPFHVVLEALRVEGRSRVDAAAFEPELGSGCPAFSLETREAKVCLETAGQYFEERERLWKIWQERTGRRETLPPAFTPDDQARTKKDLSRWLKTHAQQDSPPSPTLSTYIPMSPLTPAPCDDFD